MITTTTANSVSARRAHTARITRELAKAGATRFGLYKFAGRYLPAILAEDEQIEAAVYGRYREGAGLISLSEGWLVATDRRVIFLDHKPFYTSMDEMGYDAVTGVKRTTAGWFSAITLHSKLGDYRIRYANRQCVNNFMQVIETKRLEKSKDGFFMQPQHTPSHHTMPAPIVSNEAIEFLRSHETAVLSTVGKNGEPHGAVIYYLVGQDHRLYMLTKAGTQKVHNIFAHHGVALTVFDKDKLQTVQLQGKAEIEGDQETKNWVFTHIVKPRQHSSGPSMPPVTSLQDGAFIVVRITPTSARYIDFGSKG
ncbi:pyridoxamine 5'-phosphate oxidase family protein [Candidatus Saccharibacteria bacterium]|nr:pyridoxamine 5'-phosphate oxidase family protein [Candidatus Saccharibacteria bacterium]